MIEIPPEVPIEAPVEPEIPVEPPKADREAAKNSIQESELKEMLVWMADDEREGRMSGKKGNVATAEFIKKKFESFGLKTEMQKFSIKRMNPGPKNEVGDDFTHNIIGIIEGETDREIIVGGHMDHIGYGPQMSRSNQIAVHNGADDNASGSVSVIEIAEAFSKMDKPRHTLKFICFSAEEMGLIGSRHYVAQLSKEQRDKIDLMVNFDMVGWLKGKDLTVAGIQNIPELVKIAARLDDNYSFGVRAGAAGSGGSDHAPFGNAGIPIAFFHTGLHDHYHKPSDDIDKIDFAGQTELTKFAFEMILEFDETKLVRKVNLHYPVLNELIHDHGHPEVRFPTNPPFGAADNDLHEHEGLWHIHPENEYDYAK